MSVRAWLLCLVIFPPLLLLPCIIHFLFLGICTLCRPWEALVIGTIATLFTVGIAASLDKVKIDDPVGVIPVHLGCGVWGLICIGNTITAALLLSFECEWRFYPVGI